MATIPRTLHLFWGKQEKPLSWLRWLTVRSFCFLNPDWEVIVWYPPTRGAAPPWKTGEHVKQVWRGPDWFNRLREAGPNVKLMEAPIQDFPPLAEVHRSDLLRWRLLYRMGGWWSDFDILYFRPMSVLIPTLDQAADTLLCWGEVSEMLGWQAIGFLAGAQGSPLFGAMEKLGLELAQARHLNYQDLGEGLLKHFALSGERAACGGRIGQIPQRAVYPFIDIRGQMRALWAGKDLMAVTPTTVGVHWFGGQETSNEWEAKLLGPGHFSGTGGVFWAYLESGLGERVPGKEEPGPVRYSILMPYVEGREGLFWNTLVSYQHWYGSRKDWELVLIPDAKLSDKGKSDLQETVLYWRGKGISLRCVGPAGSTDKFNPSPHFNLGAQESRGEILLLTSPEVVHQSDVLAGLDQAFERNQNGYLVCACQEWSGCSSHRIEKLSELGGTPTLWFQHGRLRPVYYHFCSALTREAWERIGGFDEEYATGYCFDDDDFRERARAAGLDIIPLNDLLVVHQEHKPISALPPDWRTKWERNKALYESKWGPYRAIEPVRVPPHEFGVGAVPAAGSSLKYSILMPYYDRPNHLWNTLISYRHWYGNRADWEIVLIEDGKQNASQTRDLLNVLRSFTDLKGRMFRIEDYKGFNPALLYNLAASKAEGDFFILTSPEVCHVVDVLAGFDEELGYDPRSYVVCACEERKRCRMRAPNFGEIGGVHTAWYQHSQHRNKFYHFCSVLSRQSWEDLGGFDPEYAPGVAFDDDDFREKVKQAGLPMVVRDDLLTVHTWHERLRQHRVAELLNRNRQLFMKKWGKAAYIDNQQAKGAP